MKNKEAIALLYALASSHIEDLETGIEDGTYDGQDTLGAENLNAISKYNAFDWDKFYNEITQTKPTLYLLFGEEACRSFAESEQILLDDIAEDGLMGISTYEYNPNTNTVFELLEAMDGWVDYAFISKDFYTTLNNL